jgi:hypothetical protein
MLAKLVKLEPVGKRLTVGDKEEVKMSKTFIENCTEFILRRTT